MKKIKAILLLITFATVRTSQVEVDLTLRNNTRIRTTVPEKAFQKIYDQRILDLPHTDNSPSSSKKALAEDNARVATCKFENESEYIRFRKLWDIDSPASIQEQTPLTTDLFEKCLLTANFLDIQGEYAKRFAENMVNYGLLGRHSADIIASNMFSNYDLSYDTFWSLLYAFLNQLGFKYRVSHPSAGQTMLGIESDYIWGKKINKEYTGPSQTARMHTVLYSRLGLTESPETERNEAVLGWLLLNIGGSSVDIQYSMEITSEGITNFSQTIQKFTKENKKGARVYVEGLSLYVEYEDSISLVPALQLAPDLSRLELYIHPFSYTISDATLCSLFSSISLCKSLQSLRITGVILESVLVSSLVETLSTIEHLTLWCKSLEGVAIDNLKKCTRLESLDLWGESHSSTAVQALVTHLLSLKKLYIKCEALDLASAESFEKCKNLEELQIWGSHQPNTVLQALVSRLPSLKELRAMCNVLDFVTTESFEACKTLEKLTLIGRYQPSAVVQALVHQLPSLKELKIEIDTSDLDLADALRKCFNLRSLNLTVWQYTPGFIAHYLQDSLPDLEYLSLCKMNPRNMYNEEDKSALEKARAKNMIVCSGHI
ncbi:hypothetical protein NECID01_1201 [Nematocida sp. AWRm77]|nr:hypothetical protein NECID01_1201 [Nematocida sp. AWRm77]